MVDKLKIEVTNSPGIYATFQELVAREILGINVLGSIDVNGDQTEATWAPFFTPNYRLSAIGDSLAASGITLTGGAIASFSLEDTALAALTGLMSNFNQSATTVQANIDDANAMRSANGWTFDQTVAYFNAITFALYALNFFGGTGNDLIEGGQQADILRGNGGDDTVLASAGDDTVLCGAGNDLFDFSKLDALGGVDIDLAAHTAAIGGFNQVARGVEDIFGTSNADNISGDANRNTILGGDGGDTISGRGANDTIYGEGGNDVLNGNGGDDDISGGEGNDTIHGNGGNDDLYGEAGNDSIFGDSGNDFISGGDGEDELVGGADNDHILGGGGNDTINGDNGNDTIDGGADNDSIDGGGGSDLIKGGTGNDKVYGNPGADRVFGGGGKDRVYGGNGNDKLFGGLGSDVLVGGPGHDTETGGKGADTFKFYNNIIDPGPQGSDTVTDFSDIDKIVIHLQNLSLVEIDQLSGGDAVIYYTPGNIVLPSINIGDLFTAQVALDVVVFL